MMHKTTEPFSSMRVPIGEALVWIATRDPEAVAQFFGDERGAWFFGEECRLLGEALVEDAPFAELHRAIESGQVPLFGRYSQQKMRESEPIPPTLWGGNGGLRLCKGADGFYATADKIGYPAVLDLGLCRKALLKAFPPLDNQGVATDGPAMKAGRDIARERQTPDAVKLTKKAFRSALADRGVNVSNKGFERVYGVVKQEFPGSFQGRGAPKKRTPPT